MRWLSKFLGTLHLELNSEDLERCKLSKSDISLEMSSSGSSDSLGSLLESQGCLNKLEQIDPECTKAKGTEDDDAGMVIDNSSDANDRPGYNDNSDAEGPPLKKPKTA